MNKCYFQSWNETKTTTIKRFTKVLSWYINLLCKYTYLLTYIIFDSFAYNIWCSPLTCGMCKFSQKWDAELGTAVWNCACYLLHLLSRNGQRTSHISTQVCANVSYEKKRPLDFSQKNAYAFIGHALSSHLNGSGNTENFLMCCNWTFWWSTEWVTSKTETKICSFKAEYYRLWQISLKVPSVKFDHLALIFILCRQFWVNWLDAVQIRLLGHWGYLVNRWCYGVCDDWLQLRQIVVCRWSWWFAPWPFFILVLVYDELRKLFLRWFPGKTLTIFIEKELYY